MSTDAEGTARLQDTVEPHYNQVQHNIAHNTAMGKMLKPGLNLYHFVIFFQILNLLKNSML